MAEVVVANMVFDILLMVIIKVILRDGFGWWESWFVVEVVAVFMVVVLVRVVVGL